MNWHYAFYKNNERFKEMLEQHEFCPPQAAHTRYYNQCFQLKTVYPGLLLGLGNVHAVGDVEGEIQLGFSFDYVTGRPVLPGSSLKGVLKAAFQQPDYIAAVLGNDYPVDQVKELEQTIFENNDVFFDSLLVASKRKDKNFMGIDHITPHRASESKWQGLTNPIPLTMVKILPDIVMEFRFYLRDNQIPNARLSKTDLFKEIITDLGIGAKTNTGFGRMKCIE